MREGWNDGMKWALIALTMLAGTLQPLQVGANTEFRRHASHPLQAASLNMIVSAAVIFLALAIFRLPPPSWSVVKSAPWWSLLGGVCGAGIVFTMIVTAPRLGAALVIACFVTGELIASTVIDHFGFVGFEPRPITLTRVLGIGMLIGGVALVERSAL